MATRDVRLSIIVPVLNGADRLPATLGALTAYLGATSHPTELVVVDDGSRGEVPALLERAARETACVTVVRNARNLGKGSAVARGMLAARGRYRVFTDADLAYPLDQVDRIVATLESGADVAVACRVLPESRYMVSPSFFHYLYSRHLVSRAFNRLVRATLLPGILDTQAGLKGFTAAAAERCFSRLTIPRFGFDIELLLIARRQGLTVRQVPVAYRYDSEPSTVRFLRDGATMMADLVRVRWNDFRGRYR